MDVFVCVCLCNVFYPFTLPSTGVFHFTCILLVIQPSLVAGSLREVTVTLCELTLWSAVQLLEYLPWWTPGVDGLDASVHLTISSTPWKNIENALLVSLIISTSKIEKIGLISSILSWTLKVWKNYLLWHWHWRSSESPDEGAKLPPGIFHQSPVLTGLVHLHLCQPYGEGSNISQTYIP